MRKALFLLTISLIFIVASIPAQGQASDACGTMTAHWSDALGYDIGRPLVRYEVYNQQITIIEGKRRKTVQIVETNIAADHFYGELSPDCRYLAAALALKNGKSQLVAWDLLANTRVSTVDASPSDDNFAWSPNGDFAVIQTYDGGYLWNVPANKWTHLTEAGDYNNFFSYFTWDMARGQLLAVPADSGYAVRAYDLATGQIVATFDTGTQAAPVSYALSDDRSKIAVFTSEDERIYDHRDSGLAVWDRNTNSKITLNPESLSAVWVSQVRFSPDNHYLVIGRDAIRVWDLQNPRGDGLPTYQYDGPDARIGTVRFADAHTVETMSVMGCNLCSNYWLRWDLSSGQFLNAYDEPRDRLVPDFELG
ncbi:MAG: WD40 repeat domain-containing protein [Chloroflexota bacterium]